MSRILLLPFITDQWSFKVGKGVWKGRGEGICTGVEKVWDRYEGRKEEGR